jgi:PAS domain-containing protein
VLFFGALLSFLVALAAYSTGAGRSKEIAKREQLLGRLRSLPMAVIQTDAGDNITAGNDRAEELIGASLPTFGLSQKSRDSWDLFDKEHIVFFRKGKSVPTNLIGVDHKEFELRNAEAIQAERASGRHSTYYVKVRHPLHHEWLKVTAGPIFQPHSELPRAVAWMTFRRADQSDIAGTFGVLETVKHPVNEKTPSDEIALIEEYNSKIIRYLEDAGKTRRSV